VEDQRTHSNLFALKEVIVQSKNELYRSLLEYQLLVRLDHLALAHVHSLLKDDQRHRAYLLMEYIEGSNLEILRQQQPEQRFSWLETMNIMASIIAAVNYLHGHQPPIIHGDIKPTNIIMPKAGGRAVLVDFGTAKRYDLDSRTGVINHAPPVRSSDGAPEQYTTGPDLQTDIYSLGATFYTLVTGIVPAGAPSRLRRLNTWEIDPLQPVNEVLPTVPARVARAIDRAMALDADNRFLSVERFWEALWSLVEHPSFVPGDVPSASSHPPRIAKQAVVRPAVVSIPKQPRPPRAWKFGPFWPFAPKQSVARPATVSIPKYRHTPRPSIPAVTEQTIEEPAPASVAEQPPPVAPSEPVVAEQVIEEPTPVSVAEQPRMAPTFVVEQPDEKSARGSVAKPPRAPRTWRLVVLLSVVVSVIGLSISADILSRVLIHPSASATSTPSSHKPTLVRVSTIYPTLAGTYSGTIFDIPSNVRTNLFFTNVRQNQGQISGYLTVGPGLLGYGPFSGTIDAAKRLQFTVTDADGNPTLFFEGAMQSATSLSGGYYRCNSARGTPCVRGPVGYGLWNVQASSASGTSTGTNPSPGL
jgi:serine/threonine protein kinase